MGQCKLSVFLVFYLINCSKVWGQRDFFSSFFKNSNLVKNSNLKTVYLLF